MLLGVTVATKKEMKRLYDAGEREYQGHRIYGGRSEPYIERWSRREVYEIFQDIEELELDILPCFNFSLGACIKCGDWRK